MESFTFCLLLHPEMPDPESEDGHAFIANLVQQRLVETLPRGTGAVSFKIHPATAVMVDGVHVWDAQPITVTSS